MYNQYEWINNPMNRAIYPTNRAIYTTTTKVCTRAILKNISDKLFYLEFIIYAHRATKSPSLKYRSVCHITTHFKSLGVLVMDGYG